MMQETHSDEICQHERFEFGRNWSAFLSTLNEERLVEAERSLKDMLGVGSLSGKRFLDLGSGSGLFSLAARRLGASVHSVDYDPQSVSCTRALKQQFFLDDNAWTVEEGSVLDKCYISSLGKFDIVYSWGVLHHTGDMVKGFENALIPLADRGMLYISIYNDQGVISEFWSAVKKMYCSSYFGRLFVTCLFVPIYFLRSILFGLIRYRSPFGEFLNYKRHRGMSIYHDWIDWLGGYPFEVAKPEVVFQFYHDRGLELKVLSTNNSLGCNQFLFQKRVSE
ncbi:MAG: methyltransferase domain-containing protein [Pseudomonadales bacterium]|nr:methyltransferase domain-containing protein [Pseudomonadales bacterium]